MKTLYKLILFCLTISLVVSCKEKNTFKVERETFTKELNEVYEKGAVVGFSVALVNESETLYNKGFGYANTKDSISYKGETIQNIASISKTVIGISLLKAVELKLLNLDDPINKYLPFNIVNPNHPEAIITIRHLTTHSSSIIDKEDIYYKAYIQQKEKAPKGETYFTHFNSPKTRVPLLNFLKTYFSKESKLYDKGLFSKNKPGELFEYSNFGANICAMIIELASGVSYKEFTKTHVFNPLKMKNTHWDIEEIDALQRSKFYLHKSSQITDYTCITYADGGLFTSSEDLSIYLSELMKGYLGKGTLLTKESYQELFKEQEFNPTNESGRLKVGLFIEYNNNFIGSKKLLIGHNGGDLGVLTAMYFNPETEIGKILFVNTDIDYKDDIIPTIKSIWKVIGENENRFTINKNI